MKISAVTIKIIQAISTLNSFLCNFHATKMVMALTIAVMPIIFHNAVSSYIRFMLYCLPEKLKLFLLAFRGFFSYTLRVAFICPMQP